MNTNYTQLELAVKTIIEQDEINVDELSQYGCISGMVPSLIYHSDTCDFYYNHRAEINELLSETLEEYGLESPKELFGDKWECSDWLVEDTNNQNLLAWFTFETIASKVV
jgi:hypothetical protein